MCSEEFVMLIFSYYYVFEGSRLSFLRTSSHSFENALVFACKHQGVFKRMT